MKKYGLFIGIDISKKWFDVALTLNGEKGEMIHRKFDNTPGGFIQLVEWVTRQSKKLGITGKTPWLFCMEHTGVYTLGLCAFLQERGLDYVMESGLRIKRSLGIRRGKNDKSDAEDIARYAWLHVKGLKINPLPAPDLVKLKNLLSYRARLVKQRTMLKSSSKEYNAHMPDKFGSDLIRDGSKELILILTRKIRECEKEMLRIINADGQLKKLYGLVKSVKGIGLVIGVALIVYTNCFRAFDNARKFACYVAIAPFAEQSGSSINKPPRVGKMGNIKIKALLSNGVGSAIQHDPQLRTYYHRKIAEGKSKFSVLNAVKNKLVARVFAVVKRGTPFVELKY